MVFNLTKEAGRDAGSGSCKSCEFDVFVLSEKAGMRRHVSQLAAVAFLALLPVAPEL